jgi:hypothetical protein
MITNEAIVKAKECLIEYWGEDGKKVIAECAKVTPFNGRSKDFLDYCTACGGNWCVMILTGINKLFPSVWEAIPNGMGIFAWVCLHSVLILCGVDCSD